jgi:hypothetical protein
VHPEGPLCLQANAEMVPKFQVAAVCVSCSPPDINSANLNNACFVGDLSESVFFAVCPVAIYLGQ